MLQIWNLQSREGEVVDFIFSKDASGAKYDKLLVWDKDKTIPDTIKHLISESICREISR